MKIAILTSFDEFNPGYSLTGIVMDQYRMLSSYGHDVTLVARENCTERVATSILPATPLTDYQTKGDLTEEHDRMADEVATRLVHLNKEVGGFQVIITHDWCFTGWNLPLFIGLLRAFPPNKWRRFYHWIHSIPSQSRDWWYARDWGMSHKIVFPNTSDADRVAAQFRTDNDQVVTIPHIKDPRTWWDFGVDTCEFLRDFPMLLAADVVQVLPVSSDRLLYKRLHYVLEIFGRIKSRGKSVCLVVANQWATGRQRKEDIDHYRHLAGEVGLIDGREVVFTSEWDKPKFETGIPRSMLRELDLLANVFVFPTDHESFGLVVPESALSGQYQVLNRSLAQQIEISGGYAEYHHFGAYNNRLDRDLGADDFNLIAGRVVKAVVTDAAIRLKTYARQNYNWDSLYINHYEPKVIYA